MIYSSPTVNLAAFTLICLAVLAAPIYAGWALGGWIADRGEKRRGLMLLKGDRK
jgi:hypothetical protein